MSLVRLMNSPLKKTLPGLINIHYGPICSLVYNNNLLNSLDSVFSNRQKPFEAQSLRPLHVTQTNRDLEAAIKALGAGMSAISLIGPGIGLGLVFGNMCAGIARNPSASNQIFQYAIIGAAMCESIGFFGLGIAFIVMA